MKRGRSGNPGISKAEFKPQSINYDTETHFLDAESYTDLKQPLGILQLKL
jgi:hypothetical protein